jgi:hypothetical protein
LDKRNKPKKPKKGGRVEVQGVGYGDGKKYTTSTVLSPEMMAKPGQSSGHSVFSGDSIRL